MAAPALKTVHLNLPASTEDLRKLEIGSVVYLTGRVFTAREGVYKHAIEDGAGMPASREMLGLANFHCSPAASINALAHALGAYGASIVTARTSPNDSASVTACSDSSSPGSINTTTVIARLRQAYASCDT